MLCHAFSDAPCCLSFRAYYMKQNIEWRCKSWYETDFCSLTAKWNMKLFDMIWCIHYLINFTMPSYCLMSVLPLMIFRVSVVWPKLSSVIRTCWNCWNSHPRMQYNLWWILTLKRYSYWYYYMRSQVYESSWHHMIPKQNHACSKCFINTMQSNFLKQALLKEAWMIKTFTALLKLQLGPS